MITQRTGPSRVLPVTLTVDFHHIGSGGTPASTSLIPAGSSFFFPSLWSRICLDGHWWFSSSSFRYMLIRVSGKGGRGDRMEGIDSGAHMKNFTLRSPSFFFFLLVIFDIIWLNLYKHSYFVMPCLTKNCGVAFFSSPFYIFFLFWQISSKRARWDASAAS
jgi:hypothetical protein